MKEKKIVFGRLLFVICFAIAFYLGLSRINIICTFMQSVFKIASPVLVGLVIAFILNIPLKAIENIIYKIFPSKDSKKKNIIKPSDKKMKLVRTISLVLTLLLVFLLIRGLIVFVLPQLIDTCERIPTYFDNFKDFAYDVRDRFKIPPETIDNTITALYDFAINFIKNITEVIPTLLKTTQNITVGIFNFVMSVIIAIYVLVSKERLCHMFKKITYAMLDKKTADKTSKIVALANKTFTAFAKGQILEAILIGIFCYVGMLIFRLEYALLISVLTGIFALIPIFGAFFGGAIGTLLLLTISPMKALWFVVFIIVLQQLEGNLIYPKVVGTSIGISALWVLIALIIGGAVAGIPGILIGIPLFATIYELFREYVNNKLEEKEINEENL